MVWRKSSGVKSSDCSSRGARFNPQQPCGSSQLLVSPISEGLAPSQRHTCRQNGNGKKGGGNSHLNIFSDYSWQSKSGFQGWQDTGVKVLAAVPEALFDSQHPSLAAHKSLWIPILEGQMPSSGPHTRSLVFWVAFSSWVLYPECAPNEISQTALSAVPQSSGFKTLTCRVLIIVTEL